MKKVFPEFYHPDQDEFKNLWDHSHFVFDANTLLNLYMYSSDTLEDFWKIFDAIAERIWLSYQAGYEFHLNRPSRIRKQQTLFEQTIKSLSAISDEAKGNLEKIFDSARDHPSIRRDEILKKVSDFFDSLIREIKGKEEDYPDLLKTEDKILSKLSELFDDKIGDKLNDKDLNQIYKSGEERYKKNIPPGFADDKEKDDIKKFGDLVIWNELMRFSKREDIKSVIFITDDLKEDWWRIASGRTIGPHHELIKEFKEETGKDYYQCNSEQFLKFAKRNLIDVSEDSISEAKRVSKSFNERELKYLDLGKNYSRSNIISDLINTNKIYENIKQEEQINNLPILKNLIESLNEDELRNSKLYSNYIKSILLGKIDDKEDDKEDEKQGE